MSWKWGKAINPSPARLYFLKWLHNLPKQHDQLKTMCADTELIRTLIQATASSLTCPDLPFQSPPVAKPSITSFSPSSPASSEASVHSFLLVILWYGCVPSGQTAESHCMSVTHSKTSPQPPIDTTVCLQFHPLLAHFRDPNHSLFVSHFGDVPVLM